jgi:hypothetical protein
MFSTTIIRVKAVIYIIAMKKFLISLLKSHLPKNILFKEIQLRKVIGLTHKQQ